jgi:hypothetical protein
VIRALRRSGAVSFGEWLGEGDEVVSRIRQVEQIGGEGAVL